MRPGSRRRQGGATYFALLLAVAVTGLGLGAGASMLANSMRRDKEADLLFAGDQIRRAIERYHALNAAGQYPFPRDLDALLKDPYQPGLIRHLRRIYPDPMSDTGKWELIIGQGNGIIGVRSSSGAAPLKREGFPKIYDQFKAARSYADWRFVAAGGVPALPQDPQARGATPLTGAAFGSLPPLAPEAPAPRPQTLIERLQGILGTGQEPEAAPRAPEPQGDAAPRLVAEPAAPVPAGAANPAPAAAPKPPATPPAQSPVPQSPAGQAPPSPAPSPQAPTGAPAPAAPPASPGAAAPAAGTSPSPAGQPGTDSGAPGPSSGSGATAPGGAAAPAGAPAPAAPPAPAGPPSDQVQPFIMKPFGS